MFLFHDVKKEKVYKGRFGQSPSHALSRICWKPFYYYFAGREGNFTPEKREISRISLAPNSLSRHPCPFTFHHHHIQIISNDTSQTRKERNRYFSI